MPSPPSAALRSVAVSRPVCGPREIGLRSPATVWNHWESCEHWFVAVRMRPSRCNRTRILPSASGPAPVHPPSWLPQAMHLRGRISSRSPAPPSLRVDDVGCMVAFSPCDGGL